MALGILLLLSLMGLSAFSYHVGHPAWAFFFGALAVIHLALNTHEIYAPDVAYLRRFGDVVGKLTPGKWYITFPHLETVEPVKRTVFKVVFQDEKMYTGAGTELMVDIVAVFQVGENESDLKKSLEFESPEDRDLIFRQMVLSKVGTEVGKLPSFIGLNQAQTDLEKSVATDLEDEAKKYGYHQREIEVRVKEERVVSEAARIRVVGKARGEAAREYAESFRDNFPAATVALGNILEHAFLEFMTRASKKSTDGSRRKKGEGKIAEAVGKAKNVFTGEGEEEKGGES